MGPLEKLLHAAMLHNLSLKNFMWGNDGELLDASTAILRPVHWHLELVKKVVGKFVNSSALSIVR